MNAEELCQEVIDIVDDPSYEDPADILKRINRSQRRIADLLLLPDLKDGFDTVTTGAGIEVNLPDTFHKNLFHARVAGKDIEIFKDVVSMSMAREGLSTDSGDVAAVAIKKGILIYQKIPAAATDIELYFYRLPVDMVFLPEVTNPDGAYGNDDFDWAIIHDACVKIFNRIEDRMEGPKANTIAHDEMLKEKIAILDVYCKEHGEVYPKRPSSNLGWLGAR